MSARRKTSKLPPRVALDTGVVLHALLFGDAKAQRLRGAWQSGACRPLVDSASAQQLMRALAYPVLRLSAAQQHELLADFLPYAEVVGAAPEATRIDYIVSDRKGARARFARGVSQAEKGACRLLDSEQFLAVL